MILFVADDHYGVHPGLCQYESIKSDYPDMVFYENDWSGFTAHNLRRDCDLLILNMIASTCNLPLPDGAACRAVHNYCSTGKPLLLLHGGSSAFWHCDWFRRNVGIRWVRPNDPDQVPRSTHPKEPFVVKVAKSRHPLAARLVEMDLPQDEIYTELEQVNPVWNLMETTIPEGTFVQCAESRNVWGGRVINFLPGHRSEVTTHPAMTANLKTLINYLLD